MCSKKQTAGRDSLGEFAPFFAHLNDDVLFGESWARENVLSPKMRSILTVSALVSKGLIDQSFAYHAKTAKENGSDQKRDGGNFDAPCFLCRLAQCLGGVQSR